MTKPKTPDAADQSVKPDTETTPTPEQQPPGGGSWIRNDDGTLTRAKD